jgi:hypothetical protein
MNALHGSPDNGQATGFGREGINLIGTLANIVWFPAFGRGVGA